MHTTACCGSASGPIVGLGSDFGGSTTTGFDASQRAAITNTLIDAGLSEDDIRKVMGGNVRA